MEKRLYFIIHPIGALIGSQLPPKEFAEHYKYGSSKHYGGKLIFAEIDINFRNPYFNLEEKLAEIKAHEDGRPKSTKFIKTYRVLEHLDFSSIKSVYLVNSDASLLELHQEKLDPTRGSGFIRLFSGINPMQLLTLSSLNYQEFGTYITKEETKSAPSICYTQIEFDARVFLAEIEKNPLTPSPVKGIHPIKLKEAIEEIRDNPSKKTKGLSLNVSFDQIPYTMIRHGILFSNKSETALFKMPALREIEDKNIRFWKALW